MILQDFHIHSITSDGKNTLEDIVKAGIDLKLQKIGFSDHGYTEFDLSYCVPLDRLQEYKEEVKRLKSKYKSKIDIYLGIEMDYYSDISKDDFDYIIGSCHYVYKDNKYLSIDYKKEYTINFVKEYYQNDYLLFAEDYYNNMADIVNKTGADIIGHFDLITKYNENNELFDMRGEKYLSIARNAIDKLISYNKPFEVNTGAISRGYRTNAYPDLPLLEYIYKRGGKVILSSDSHSKDNLCYKFDEYENLIKKIGFKDYLFKI